VKINVRTTLLGSLALSMLASCGSTPPPAPATPQPAPLATEFDGAPKWVLVGCGAFFGEKKNLVCGVGAVAGMTNPALARSAAQGRGRTEISRSLQVRVKAMLKDYQDATQGGSENKVASEQKITDVSVQVSNMTLAGTKLQDVWISKNQTFYALMVLDVEAFRGQLKNMEQLDEKLRAAIDERAQKTFEELDARTEGPLPALPPEPSAPTASQ
jgi:hypothetical protein